MCYTLGAPARKQGGFDKFLRSSMKEDAEFRRLFWQEVAKLPARSRRRIEKHSKDLPK